MRKAYPLSFAPTKTSKGSYLVWLEELDRILGPDPMLFEACFVPNEPLLCIFGEFLRGIVGAGKEGVEALTGVLLVLLGVVLVAELLGLLVLWIFEFVSWVPFVVFPSLGFFVGEKELDFFSRGWLPRGPVRGEPGVVFELGSIARRRDISARCGFLHKISALWTWIQATENREGTP